jgi:hypothetical protein
MHDITPDDLGIALGLGEEIVMNDQAGEMSQKDSDGVLSKPINRNENLIPVSNFNPNSKVVDLTDFNNWIVDFTKRLRSPFVEKWKMVAMGTKTPDAPLLTQREAQAYYAAHELVVIDNDMDKETRRRASSLKNLKRIRARLKMIEAGQKILKHRYGHGKDKNNG